MSKVVAVVVLSLLCCAGEARAQPRIDARVISVSGRSVYIDAGREAGVRPGLAIIIILTNGQRIEAMVQEVSANNARVEIGPQDPVPDQSARAEIIATPGPTPGPSPSPATDQPAKPVPEHPPWSRAPEQRSADTPLLAPAFSTPPGERPTTVHGRVFMYAQQSHDSKSDFDYTIGRVGSWLEVTNPFKEGGRILFSGDLDYRGTDLTDGKNNDTKGRIDRLSYAYGLDRGAPYRFELGRFYSTALPEIGLFDGAEAKLRLENGWSLGTGVGFYPLANDESEPGTDYGFHTFAEYQPDADSILSSVIGYQETWHDGRPDRNLLIGRLNLRPSDKWWIYAMAMVDIYGPGDTIKDTAGLTQALAQATYTPSNNFGVATTFVHTSWPELLREEYGTLPADLVKNGVVDRISVNTWERLTDHLRITGRANYWMDQDSDGLGGELGLDILDVGVPGSYLYTGVFYETAAFNDGLGGRIQLRVPIGQVQASLGYDVYAYTLSRFQTGSESYLRHSIRADVGWGSGSWYYDVDGSYNFGDNENSVSLGIFVEYRF